MTFIIEETRTELAASALRAIRLDTGLRLNGLRDAFDRREDTIEVLIKTVSTLSEGVEDVIKSITCGTANIDNVFATLNNARLKAKGEMERLPNER